MKTMEEPYRKLLAALKELKELNSKPYVNPYHKEITPEKGLENGNCNRQACQKPGATWWNRGSEAWYCPECAKLINMHPIVYNGKVEPALCTLGKPSKGQIL
jgi:rubredoxin